MAKWIEKWNVASSSDSSKIYVVSKGDDGTFGCSCPAWTRMRRECKHIKEVKLGRITSSREPVPEPLSVDEETLKESIRAPGAASVMPLLQRLKNEAPWRFEE